MGCVYGSSMQTRVSDHEFQVLADLFSFSSRHCLLEESFDPVFVFYPFVPMTVLKSSCLGSSRLYLLVRIQPDSWLLLPIEN